MTFAGLPAVRDMSGQWYAVMGIDRDSPNSYRTQMEFAKAPADEAWVYSCVRKLYSSAAGVPLRVYIKNGRDLIPAVDEPSAEGDDLQALLDYVNPVDMTGSDLKAYTMASYACWGESYIRKVRGRFGGPPQELFWLRAPDVTIEHSDGRTPTAYEYRPTQGGTAAAATYMPRDIVPWKTPNLVDPLRGLSPLSSVGQEIATGRGWAERMNYSLNNDSVPPGYWQIPANAEFAKQDENLVRRALRALRGPKQKGRSPILPAGIEYKAIALTPQDAEMVAARKISRMAVCAALGVPLVLAGDDDKASVYANLRDAERVFWRGTMLPTLDSFADALNNWLTPDFDPTRKRLTIAFDYSQIEALRPTLDVEWNMWISGVYAQVRTPNQFIRHFRLGPDVPWGDKPVPRTAVALRPDPAAIPEDGIPTLDPEDVAPIKTAPVAAEGPDVAGSLRAYGKGLYRHPAVKTWVADPTRQLDTRALLGSPTSDDTRSAIEDGLRRRASAVAIADSLS